MASGAITVRYFAGARTAAGVPEETLAVPSATLTLEQLMTLLANRRGGRLERVLGAASFLVDGVACRDRGRELRMGTVVDVLPPFAGG